MVALEPAWIGVIGTGIGAFASGIPAFATALVQSLSAKAQRKQDAAQAQAQLDAEAVEAKAQRDAERNHEESQRRRALIALWRAGIATLGDAGLYAKALQTPWYETLRPYLTSDVVAKLEGQRTVLVMPDTPRGGKNLFTGEVDRIEREWGLRP